MKAKFLLAIVAGLLVFVSLVCVISEVSWRTRENAPDSLRQLVGLPSLVIGNLNPAARNPGLEVFCTGLSDVPGGYCSYFTDGVPFINFTMFGNVTVVDGK